jgi:hypothetical protein
MSNSENTEFAFYSEALSPNCDQFLTQYSAIPLFQYGIFTWPICQEVVRFSYHFGQYLANHLPLVLLYLVWLGR